MDRIKPYLEATEKHIRAKEFKQALDQAETALLFMGTNFQANLYAGRCCIELKDYNKAEGYIKQALDTQPENLDCLKSLCILYKANGKNDEYFQALRKIADILKKKKMFPQYYDQILKFYEKYAADQNYAKLQEVYEELSQCEGIEESKQAELHIRFFKDGFAYMDPTKPQTEKTLLSVLQSCKSQTDLEDILERSVTFFQNKYLKSGKYKEFYNQLLKFEKEHPQTVVLLKSRIEHSPIILDEKEKLVELYQEVVCFMLFNNVFPGVPENLVEDAKKVDSWKRYAKYQGLSLTNKPLFDEINRYAVTFQKFFDIAHLTSLIHNPQATQIIEQIPKTRIEYCFEQCEKLSFLLAYPVKIEFFLSIENREQALALHKEFLDLIQKTRSFYNLNILEEVHASIGLEIGLNPEELVAASNNIKNLLKQNPDNIDNMKLFYHYQTKIIKQLRRIDEDLNLFNIVSHILDKEPKNPFYLSEKAWLILSNQNLNDNYATIESLLSEALTQSSTQDHHLQAQISLRLATVYMLKDQSNKENIQKARELYLKAWQLDPNEIKCFKAQALLYAFCDKDYAKALKCLTVSFDLEKIDEDYFKLQFYLLMKCGYKEQALTLLKAIYRYFRNTFWVNYTLGILLIENQDYNRSLTLITRACELYEYYQKEKPYLGYRTYEELGARYLAQTHGIAYVEDIPFLSSSFYEKNDSRTLSDAFFLSNDPMVEFHLYYVYCQINKNLGKIGSAYKTIERLELVMEKTDKVEDLVAHHGDCPPNDDVQRYEDLKRIQKIIEDQFLILGPDDLLKKGKSLTSYDMKKHGIEVLILFITKATLAFYLSNFTESFKCLVEAIQHLAIIHKWKIPNLDYKRALLLERELISVVCEVMVKYTQNTLAKEIIDIALYRLEAALKIVDFCKNILQESISVFNIYLNRSLSDLYLFKGLHGHCEESLLKAQDYLRRILKTSLVGFEEIENGAVDRKGEVSEKMTEEGRCVKSQEVIYDCLYNMTLIYLNLARRKQDTAGYLEKAKNLAKFGITNFENNSPFWLLYAFTEETEKKKKAALLAGISVDPQNVEAINALSYSFLKEKKISFATKLLLKSLEFDTVENYKAFNGLGLVNTIVGLELIRRKNGVIEGKKNYVKTLFENAKHFLDKAYFYSLNSQEIIQTALAEKFQAIFFYVCGDFEKAVAHFENYFRYQRGPKTEQTKTQDAAFWQYYIISLLKSGRKGLFVPTVSKDSFVTPDILALVDRATSNNHQYQDKLYSQFLQSLCKNDKNDNLANILNEDLEKSWEEWTAQSTELLTKGATGQMNLYTAFSQFRRILRLIQMIGSLYLIDKQYESCYEFLTDYLSSFKTLETLKKLEKYHLEYTNLTNEYQKILALYLNCLIQRLKTNQGKDPASIHHDLEVVITAISDNAASNGRPPFNLVFNQDVNKPETVSKSPEIVELLSGISNLLIGDLSKAKLHLLRALQSDCESQLVRRVLSLYYVLHERKGAIIPDYNLAAFNESKVRRDYDLDSTANVNKSKPLYLDLIGDNNMSYALIEYLAAYNKCQNPEKRRKLITRAAIYLRDINVWFLYCVEMLQHAIERTPRRLYYLLSVLYTNVVREIVKITSAEKKSTYNKILKNAIKVAYEIQLLFERSDFSEKEQYAKEVNELVERINSVAQAEIGAQKVTEHKKKLELFHNSDKISKEANLEGLFKSDISNILFAKEVCVKLYENNWNGDLEGLLSNFRKHLVSVLEQREQKGDLSRKDRVKLEGALLQTELMLYTVYLRETVLTEGKPEQQVNALEKLGEAFEWCKTHVNKNKQVYTLLLNHYHQTGEGEAVEAYLTTLNYVEAPENVTQTANLYCMLAFYNQVQNESLSVEEKEELFENIGIIADDILANTQETPYVLGVTYYVKGLCELMRAEKSQAIDPKKVKSIFAKAALFVPAHARNILKNFM